MANSETTYIIHGADVVIGTDNFGTLPWGVNLSTTEAETAEVKEYPGPSGNTETVVISNIKKELNLELLATKGADGVIKPAPGIGDIVEVDGVRYIAVTGSEKKYATSEAMKFTVKLTHFPSVKLENIG